ncbi:hypothetical protein [Streptomyces sp. NBC_00385]|uniref:hypothetical protein n=1 Tax=Streptomyces sp. NBC_00385 TaxID=2975733 RepID=UPI002DD7DB66|nr:hypothetical protein [Streptomyces sp. NBC_00385]WRZ07885.1 hypothetical protein OG959_33385 [Streptomyces sp. NBC_00385]
MPPFRRCSRQGCPFDAAPDSRTCGKHCHIWLKRRRIVADASGAEADVERAELARLEAELNNRASSFVNVPGVFSTDLTAAMKRPVRRPRRH